MWVPLGMRIASCNSAATRWLPRVPSSAVPLTFLQKLRSTPGGGPLGACWRKVFSHEHLAFIILFLPPASSRRPSPVKACEDTVGRHFPRGDAVGPQVQSNPGFPPFWAEGIGSSWVPVGGGAGPRSPRTSSPRSVNACSAQAQASSTW